MVVIGSGDEGDFIHGDVPGLHDDEVPFTGLADLEVLGDGVVGIAEGEGDRPAEEPANSQGQIIPYLALAIDDAGVVAVNGDIGAGELHGDGDILEPEVRAVLNPIAYIRRKQDFSQQVNLHVTQVL